MAIKQMFQHKLILAFGCGALSLGLSGCFKSQPYIPSDASATPNRTYGNVSVSEKATLESQFSVIDLADQSAKDNEQTTIFLRDKLSPFDKNNLWHDFRQRLNLAELYFGLYDEKIDAFLDQENHVEIISERAAPYLHFIKSEVERRQMPYELALLPAIESGFKAQAKSHKSAVGLWQFISSTGRSYGLDKTAFEEQRSDVIMSTDAALNFLADLNKQFQGDWLLALSAYNCGGGCVNRAIRKFREASNQEDSTFLPSFWEISPYLPKETRDYAPKLLAFSHLVEFSELYNIELYPIVNQSVFSVTKVNQSLSLDKIADKLAMSREEIKRLNPSLLFGITPRYSHFLVLPKEKQLTFETLYQSNPKQFAVDLQFHIVRSGDYLGKIARIYGTSVANLKRLNNKRSNHLRIGEKLLVSNAPINFVERQSQMSNIAHQSPVIHSNGSYKVKAGDSLWRIARKFNMSLNQIMDINGLDSRSTLRIGQTLKVSAPSTAVAKSQKTTKGKAEQKILHKVNRGEVISKIAEIYGVKSSQILKWNKLNAKSIIRPGQSLVVYQGKSLSRHKQYQVKNGDSLWLIAKRYNVSSQKLAQYNNINPKNLLKPGMVIKVPYI